MPVPAPAVRPRLAESVLATDYIKSPVTNRLIKIGGKQWRKLVNENIIENSAEKVIADIPNDETDIQQTIEKLDEELPDDVQAVRGRGVHKGKIVKRSVQPSIEKITKHTAKLASKVVADTLDGETNMSREEIEVEFERLIMEELTHRTVTKPANRIGNISKLRLKGSNDKYETKPIDIESSDSDSE